jgi:hypothetical protein
VTAILDTDYMVCHKVPKLSSWLGILITIAHAVESEAVYLFLAELVHRIILQAWYGILIPKDPRLAQLVNILFSPSLHLRMLWLVLWYIWKSHVEVVTIVKKIAKHDWRLVW